MVCPDSVCPQAWKHHINTDTQKRVVYECSGGCFHVYHWECYRSGLRNRIASLRCNTAPTTTTRGWPPGEFPCLTESCQGRIIHLLVTEGTGESRREHWDVNRKAWDEAHEQQQAMQLAAQKRMQRAENKREDDDWRRWQRLAEEEAAAAASVEGQQTNYSDASESCHAEVASTVLPPHAAVTSVPDFTRLQLRRVARDEDPNLEPAAKVCC